MTPYRRWTEMELAKQYCAVHTLCADAR